MPSPPRWSLHTEPPIAWTAGIALVAASYALVLPVDLVLGNASPAWLSTVLWTITALFVVDAVVNMQSARTRAADRGPAESAWWRFADWVAAIPLSPLHGALGPGLPGLAKLARVGRSMRRWRTTSLRHWTSLVFLFASYWLALAIHWLASGWMALRGGSTPAAWTEDYVDALYWTVTTVTTVGYGDVTPEGTAQRLYAIVTMVAGLAFFGYIIGIMASTLSRQDPARTAYEENIERLAMAVRYGGLPPELQRRIHEYYTYMWQQRLGYDESDFLDSLPMSLREEVALHIKRDVLDPIDLFHGAPAEFVRYVALRLRPEVLTPGDWIFREGSEGHRMYFLVRGQVEVVLEEEDDDERLAVLGPGDFFGEIALFLDVPRTASVRALTYCDIYSLSKGAFQEVIQRFPEQGRAIEAKALARNRRTEGRREESPDPTGTPEPSPPS